MTKNPLVNALAAALYIALVGTVMFYGLRAYPNIRSPINCMSSEGERANA